MCSPLHTPHRAPNKTHRRFCQKQDVPGMRGGRGDIRGNAGNQELKVNGLGKQTPTQNAFLVKKPKKPLSQTSSNLGRPPEQPM